MGSERSQVRDLSARSQDGGLSGFVRKCSLFSEH